MYAGFGLATDCENSGTAMRMARETSMRRMGGDLEGVRINYGPMKRRVSGMIVKGIILRTSKSVIGPPNSVNNESCVFARTTRH
jgi:hypothetical protein